MDELPIAHEILFSHKIRVHSAPSTWICNGDKKWKERKKCSSSKEDERFLV
jgi:hypothetical protein